ncbi:UNVERIFIED_CONTAM: hypothetical protein GTU68_038192 [Idotea baltica]|nr:hypothetical protein [Idotea baltica]
MRQHPEDYVIALDALTYAGNEASLDDLKSNPNFRFVAGSIADQALMEKLLVEDNIDTIVNFAAESHVDRSISGPDIFLETNVIGTHNILKAAPNPNHRFHHVSTDEVYGELDDDSPGFTEEHVYAPNSPYSASKASSDHIVRAYHHTFGLNVSTTNCSNNYGPYQYPEKLIPLFLTNILRNKNLPVYGTGKNVRDWLFADDHAQGIDLILNSDKIGEVYNIGGNNEWNNMDIINLLCTEMEKSADLITFVEDRAGHDWRYAIDASKFKRELGYDPIETFETGIQKTISWYLDNEDWWRPLLVK